MFSPQSAYRVGDSVPDRRESLLSICGIDERTATGLLRYKMRWSTHATTFRLSKMRVTSLSLGLTALLSSSVVVRGVPSFRPFFRPPFNFPSQPRNAALCTLKATGGDDAPQFLKAIKTCPTVTIPASTTLSIQTRMDMTGLRDRHIVSQFGNKGANL